MSDLLPIHPESQVARDIARLEEALRRIRTVVTDAGVADRLFASEVNRQESFSKLMFTGEGQWDFQQFYNSWGISWRMRGRNRPVTFPMHQSGPQWVKFSTEDRLAWGRLLPTIVEALAGSEVSLTLDHGWRWDHQRPRPNGRPRCIRNYKAMLCGTAAKPFVPGKLGEQLVASHCMVDHPICDVDLFEWRDDLRSECGFTGYHWTPGGFVLSIWEKRNPQEACSVLLGGLAYTLERTGKGEDTHWTVTVDLAGSPADALDELAKSIRRPYEEECEA